MINALYSSEDLQSKQETNLFKLKVLLKMHQFDDDLLLVVNQSRSYMGWALVPNEV